MRPVSQAFLKALTGSHNMAVRVRAVPAGQTGTAPVDGITLDVLGGDVQLDGTADVRATVEIEVSSTDPTTGAPLWPEGAGSPLTPYGTHELFVERGVAFGGGTIEFVSLGYFRINTVEQPDAPNGPIRIAGSDRMSMIIDSKLTTAVQFAPSDTYGDVVSALAVDAYADVEIEWDDPDVEGDAIGRTAIVESDRYAFIRELVVAVGKAAYFDHRGVMLIRTPPSSGYPSWVVSRGRQGVLVSAGRSLSRDGVYNGVLATGEALDTEPPVRGLAVDSTPGSPTLWGGPFGKISREFASPLLTTEAQCRLAAATVLRKSLGLPYNVDMTAVPNPALEPDDLIAIGIEGEPTVADPVLLVGDSFSRTVVDGMGSSESGHSWNVGTNVLYQVNAGVLHKTMNSNTTAAALISAVYGRRDLDLYVDVQAPIVATGASLIAGHEFRYSGNNDYYTARIEFDVAGVISLKLGDHHDTYSEPVVFDGFATYTAAQWWTIYARVHGDTVQFKAWPRDDPEPRDWAFAYDQLRPAGTTSNRFGLWWWRLSANTNNTGPQFRLDNYRAYALPLSPLRGGELHILDTLTIPLTADGAMSGRTREQTLVTIETS